MVSSKPFQGASDDTEPLQLQALSTNPRTPSPMSEGFGTDALTEQETLPSRHQSRRQQAPNYDFDHEYNDTRTAFHRSTGILIREAQGHSQPHISTSVDGHDDYANSVPRREPILSNWVVEFLVLLVAAGRLVAIYQILTEYYEKEIPDWAHVGITLNTLIAILSTLLRAALAFVAFEVLTQLKWDWVSTRFRPMHHFQLFDNASRGVYGSLRLLPVIAFRQPIAIVAIIIVVLSFAIGPFVQQTIQPYPCLQPSGSSGQVASINAATTVEQGVLDKAFSSSSSAPLLKIGLKTAMQDSLVNPSTDSNVPSMFTCSSGNCTFTPLVNNSKSLDDQVTHASVGICNRCIDVSKLVQGPETVHLKPGGEALQFKLPILENETDPMMLQFGWENRLMSIRHVPNLTWADDVASDGFLNLARWSIRNISILVASQDRCDHLPGGNVSCRYNENGPLAEGRSRCSGLANSNKFLCSDYFAATCIVFPCIKSYSARVENGTLFEKTIREVPLRPQDKLAMWSADSAKLTERVNWAGVQQPCVVNGTLYTSANMSKSRLRQSSAALVYSHAESWETESIQHQVDYVNVTAPQECIYWLPGNLVEGLQIELRQFNANCTVPEKYEDLSCTSDTEEYTDHLVALRSNASTSLDTITESFDSMTRRLTTEIRQVGSRPYSDTPKTVLGEVFENRTCVHIDLLWLILPLALLALCLVLLSWIIVRGFLGKNPITWKSSLIPLLLRSHTGLEQRGIQEMEKIAENFELKVPWHKQG